MDVIVVIAACTIAVVLIFDYTNGFHDASNIVATVVASRAMTPIQAVIVVATFEFLGPLQQVPHNRLMADVHAIESTDGRHAGAVLRAQVV